MDPKSKRQNRQDDTLALLNAAIEAMNLAKEVVNVTPVQAAFASVAILLGLIRDSMANEPDYVELGLACADVCKALQQGMDGKRPSDLNQSVREAIAQLRTIAIEIRENLTKNGERSLPSQLVHARSNKDKIAAWRSDLNRVLQVFTAELVMNVHHDVSKTREIGGQVRLAQAGPSNSSTTKSTGVPSRGVPLGESPPASSRTCFGRDELIEKVVSLSENLSPVALIGAGGIGKTSIALTVLHHNRIKQRFGNDRRFIRCDQFPASRIHLLSRLSEVIGAGVKNPEDITPLRPFLSSREMIVILDNAESILDPRGPNAQEIYDVVKELSRFNNICLCITSRISTIPPDCETLVIPTLPKEAARDAFYRIYKNGGPSRLVDNILERLDFHPLSITLLATVACHNKWDTGRLSREWERQQKDVFQTGHDISLAATIELSLASPMFQELGPGARGLLEVVAFFPQGVNEGNIDWLFPTKTKRTCSWWFPSTPNRKDIFDKFCVLSLAYRSNGFIRMLAPLRDYLSPKDPASHPLLRTTKKRYFSRLSVDVGPRYPGFKDASWITSEDVNAEHLLDVFTTVDAGASDIWDVCCCFMKHLYWHKPRLIVLGPKIQGLPDDHRFKPKCLVQLARLFGIVGNRAESKRLFLHTLKLWRERGDDHQVANTLSYLADANRPLGLRKEGMEQAKEAAEIFKRLNNKSGQATSLHDLAELLYHDGQLDAAEEAASRVIGLLFGQGDQFTVCQSHHLLGNVYRSKDEAKKAIDHYETALRIASSSNWSSELFRTHHSLAELFLGINRFDDAHTHVERAKPHAINDPYNLGTSMELRTRIWFKQRRFGEAKSEALRAIGVFEGLGAAKEAEHCRAIIRNIDRQ